MNRILLKTILITLLITGAFLVALKAQSIAEYKSKWYPGLAGDDIESKINRMQFNDKSQLLFLVANDQEKLYVDLIVADRASIQKIMRYGLTTWFNTSAKHKKELGIEFPVTAEGAGDPAFMKDKGGEKKDMRLAMMVSKNREMVLIGFDGKKEKRAIDLQKDREFYGNVEMLEGGRLHISLAVPLERIGRSSVESHSLPVSLGFETGYMDLTGQGGMPSGGGSQGGGMPGGGAPYGGGMYGGGPPPGAGQGSMTGGSDQQQKPDISQLASPTRLWIKKVILAVE